MSIKRFDVKEGFTGFECIEENVNGTFISYDDYTVLQARITELEKDLFDRNKRICELLTDILRYQDCISQLEMEGMKIADIITRNRGIVQK